LPKDKIGHSLSQSHEVVDRKELMRALNFRSPLLQRFHSHRLLLPCNKEWNFFQSRPTLNFKQVTSVPCG